MKCNYQVPGEAIFPELKRGVVAKCDRCLKILSETSGAAGKKRKRAKSKNREGVEGEKVERARKKKYSEDSSAEEDEVNFREAGVMKVYTNLPNSVGERANREIFSRILHSLAKCFRIPSMNAYSTMTAIKLTY